MVFIATRIDGIDGSARLGDRDPFLAAEAAVISKVLCLDFDRWPLLRERGGIRNPALYRIAQIRQRCIRMHHEKNRNAQR